MLFVMSAKKKGTIGSRYGISYSSLIEVRLLSVQWQCKFFAPCTVRLGPFFGAFCLLENISDTHTLTDVHACILAATLKSS